MPATTDLRPAAAPGHLAERLREIVAIADAADAHAIRAGAERLPSILRVRHLGRAVERYRVACARVSGLLADVEGGPAAHDPRPEALEIHAHLVAELGREVDAAGPSAHTGELAMLLDALHGALTGGGAVSLRQDPRQPRHGADVAPDGQFWLGRASDPDAADVERDAERLQGRMP